MNLFYGYQESSVDQEIGHSLLFEFCTVEKGPAANDPEETVAACSLNFC
jgi:hypothetical protein